MILLKFIVPRIRLSKNIVSQNAKYETIKLDGITDENLKIYAIFNSNTDIAKTLYNLTGKWIKKIQTDEVEFEE
ncbi:MAG: hypothetical protein ACUVTX_06760 [Bacteroidales bacterium]